MPRELIGIIGCGDVGLRIAMRLVKHGIEKSSIIPIVRSEVSQQALIELGFMAVACDFDDTCLADSDTFAHLTSLYYLVPPQKKGERDQRSRALIEVLKKQNSLLSKVVLISTTGVYGDCLGEQVTENTPLNPTTPRSVRRADMEQQWRSFVDERQIIMSTLRVPGIYSYSRLPKARLESQSPIVNPDECGFTNRIHADDLAMICHSVMDLQTKSDVYNATDGHPGKMSQYFLDVAKFLGISTPPLLSFSEAETVVTSDMMSYLRESRKIDNRKLLDEFNLKLAYEDYREGIRF